MAITPGQAPLEADTSGDKGQHAHSNGVSTANGVSTQPDLNGVKSVPLPLEKPLAEQVEHNPKWVVMEDHVLWKPQKKVKVISIGCGFSGLTLAHKIQHKYKLDDRIEHTLYEKNSDVGGTWFENRYPGVLCDVPAHIYTLLDVPNTEWPAFYATGGDIEDYLRKITKEHNLDRDVVYNSKVTSAIWNEDEGLWHVTVQQGDKTIQDTCQILINGSGVLNAWSWPDIKGLSSFKGDLLHSADYAEWAKKPVFDGKRVAVIGNGSSAIQIVPELASVASHLYNIVRSPTWISAPFVEELSGAPGTNPQYTEEQKEAFRKDPQKHTKYRHDLAHAFNHFYEALIEGSAANQEAQRRTKALMESRIGDRPELAELLIPKWSLGCRRLTPGNGYLEAICSPKVDLVVGNIDTVTETGITMQDGKQLELDAIICATGFDVSFKPRWVQEGRDGRSLAKEWEVDAQGYLSLCVSGQPNYFIYNGPCGPVGHGSLSSAIDWEAEYILKWVNKVAQEGIKSFNVKQDVQDEWNIYGDEVLKRTVWTSGCKSWYKNDLGRIFALYPGSILHFKDLIENIRAEDFDITYQNKKNRWGFCGNGFTQLEIDGGDLAYYIK
ncbi:putative sterigmatocystin biosynthesis monooxygenase stcW [Fonsecaea pedrosoi]|nr:putative sterigmatocystin biosynthesis monooxygenase stcW [Fonsecaea pedrosoi]